MSCSYNIGDFDFEQADIDRVVQQKGLLSIEVEFSPLCNFRCPYCYMGHLVTERIELTPEEGRSVLQQARDLGARKIIVLGGEPMLYPHIFEMVEACRAMDLTVEMFTNGSRIDRRRLGASSSSACGWCSKGTPSCPRCRTSWSAGRARTRGCRSRWTTCAPPAIPRLATCWRSAR